MGIEARAFRRLVLLLPALAAALAFWPALHGQPVWDDLTLLRPEILAAPLQALPFNASYFRPLGVLSLSLEAWLWSDGAWGHHLGNLLLHVLDTALVTLLLRRLVDPEDRHTWAPVVLGSVYALHPALVEPVAFISSRFDLLLTTSLLLALWADGRLRGAARVGVLALAFLAAAASKESAVVFPLVLLCWHRALAPQASWRVHWRAHGWTYVALVAAGLTALGLRAAMLGQLVDLAAYPKMDSGDALQRLLLVAQTLATDLGLMLWPYGWLSPIHQVELPVPLGSWAGWTSLGVVLALLGGLTWAAWRRSLTGWLGLAALAALLPTANLVPLDLSGGAITAERFLTWPLALALLAGATWLAPRLSWSRRPGWVVALALWLGFGVAGVRETTPHWRDEVSLWTWAMEVAPRSALPPTNLARVVTDGGDPGRGLALAHAAIGLDPRDAMARNNEGQALFHLGEHEAAVESFRLAIELEPEAGMYYANLGGALQAAGHLDEARVILEREALPRLGEDHLALRNLGATYLSLGRPDLALPPLQRALQLAGPDQRAPVVALLGVAQDPAAWIRLGDELRGMGALDQALAALDRAATLGASPLDVAVSGSSVLIEQGELRAAEALLVAALPEAGADARPFFNLGVIAEQAGSSTARQWYTEAATRDPSWALPRLRLQELGEQE